MENILKLDSISFYENSEHEASSWIKSVLHSVYEKEYRPLWKKYGIYTSLIFVTLFEVVFLNYRYQKYTDAELDALAISVDFGEFVQLQQKKQVNIIEIDEIFGNEFVRDPEKIAEEILNVKISSAANPVMADATLPVDLTPQIRPLYPPAAKNAGIEGILTLELVIDKDGTVLRARPVGNKLGYGLEESAVSSFSKKKFQPSIDKNGKPIIVKFFQPVQYTFE